jgi:hypothetical protein
MKINIPATYRAFGHAHVSFNFYQEFKVFSFQQVLHLPFRGKN